MMRELDHIPIDRVIMATCIILTGCPGPTGGDKESPDTPTDTGHDTPLETGNADSRIDDSEETDGTAETDTGPEPLGVAAAKLMGEDPGDGAGVGVAAAGDVDGDGLDDLLVGAYGNGLGGSAYLVSGPVSGRQSLTLADAKLVGTEEGGDAGGALAGAGDVDGDGYADVLIGGIGDSALALTVAAWLVYTPVAGVTSLDEADAHFVDGEDGEAGGNFVAGPGDVNGDGWEDLLIAAPGGTGSRIESDLGHCADDDVEEHGSENGAVAGRVYIVLGPPASETDLSTTDAQLIGEDGGDAAGAPSTQVGDLNGDGLSDIFVGAPRNCESGLDAGAAYIVLGPVSGEIPLTDADAKLMPEEDQGGDDLALAGGGDSNGDGYGDAVLGWMWDGADVTGVAYLVLGPTVGPVTMDEADASLSGEDSEDWAGSSVSWIGDINLDGFDDLAVGALLVSVPATQAGAAYIALGPLSGSQSLSAADVKVQTGVMGDSLGATLAGVGDTNGDGLPDLLIGATGDDEGGDLAGAAWLLLGGPGLASGTL